MVIVGYFDPVFFPILDIDLLYFLTNLLLYYIIFYFRVYLVIHYKFINNLLYFCSGDKFLSVGLSIFVFVFLFFFFEFYISCFTWERWSPYNFISNFITNQITSCSCCFLNCSFWRIFSADYCRGFWLHLPLAFLTMFFMCFYCWLWTSKC